MSPGSCWGSIRPEGPIRLLIQVGETVSARAPPAGPTLRTTGEVSGTEAGRGKQTTFLIIDTSGSSTWALCEAQAGGNGMDPGCGSAFGLHGNSSAGPGLAGTSFSLPFLSSLTPPLAFSVPPWTNKQPPSHLTHSTSFFSHN